MNRPIRIATRASRLALWQATFVQQALLSQDPSRVVELVPVTSSGDVVLDRPLYELGGVGVFTKEIQSAVLTGEADVAVHSLKDLPTLGPAELVLAAIPERGPTGDVLLSPSVDRLSDLPRGARIATSSLRRKAQLLRYRSDLVIESIRGNVETRIRKMYDEGFDGLILAEAGVRRLGLDAEIREVIDPQVLLPAVGQGALGIECRTEDVEVIEVLSALDHSDSRACVNAERSLLRTIEGGCQVPVGVRTELAGSELRLAGVVLSPDGTRWREGSVCGSIADATTLGEELGLRFLEEGAAELLL